MSELGDVLGDDFENKYESKTQQRREKANKVDKETLKAICHTAINGTGFDGEEPRFTFDGDEVPHDVMLMESPDQDIQKFRHSFQNGGVSLGMFHLGELFNLAFSEDMLDVVDQIQEGKYYIVVGRYQEKKVSNDDGTENTYYNISPVRGILPLPQAKKFAEEYDEEMSKSSVEEQKQDQVGGSSDNDSGSSDSSSDDYYDEIVEVLRYVAKEKESVIEDTADGDKEQLSKLTGVIKSNVDDSITEDDVVRVFEAEIQEIDDGEEDDGLDLGGLDDSDDENETEEQEPEPELEDDDDSEEEESADDEDNEGESADDWF